MDVIVLFGIALAFAIFWALLCQKQTEFASLFGRVLNQLRFSRVQAWFRKRFSREERFGLSLTIGLTISLLAGWFFGELADEILEEELLTQLDLTFGEGLLELVSGTTSQIFYWITMTANPIVLIAGVIAVSLWLVNRQRIADTVMFLTAVGGGALINLTLKLLFSRPRPDFLDMFYQEIGFSFPSGHAMLSVLFYGMVAYLIGRGLASWRGRFAWMALAMGVALIVGVSRLVLGVHFLSDVLAGWAAGVVWLSTCITAREISAT